MVVVLLFGNLMLTRRIRVAATGPPPHTRPKGYKHIPNTIPTLYSHSFTSLLTTTVRFIYLQGAKNSTRVNGPETASAKVPALKSSTSLAIADEARSATALKRVEGRMAQ